MINLRNICFNIYFISILNNKWYVDKNDIRLSGT